MANYTPETGDVKYDSFLNGPDASLDHLLTLFQAKLSKKQISAIFDLACHDFDTTMECLLSGPDLNNNSDLKVVVEGF